jgi:4-amino-4-deoxy-L-arabinose transferase-like glycosyltransferase
MGSGLVVVLVAWMGCVLLCAKHFVSRFKDWRLYLISGTCLWAALLAILVEILSLFHALNKPALLIAWSALAAGVWLLVVKAPAALEFSPRECRRCLNELPVFAKCCWIGVTLIAALLLGVAVTTPPTNWDSMAYHLPRVLHWIQNGSVAHFATDNTRQIEFGPLGGFIIAHLLLLGGSDQLVNLPQWTAMLLSVLAVSLMVELLAQACLATPSSPDFLRRAGAMASVFTVTIPMGMMQSLTPQTDYLTAFWMAAAFVFALAFYLQPSCLWLLAGCGLACGLGTLTKGTTYVYAAPLVLAGVVWVLRQPNPFRGKLKLALVFSSGFFLLNGPHFMRNQALFGSPLGSDEIHKLECNERMTPITFASNLIRNLALHNNCGLRPVTRTLNAVATKLHEQTGARIDDPRTTYPPGPVKFIDRFIVYDDYASAPVHLLWIVVGLTVAVARWREAKKLVGYAALIAGSFAIFVALLKYQFWHSRFHLAYFILLSPMVALALTKGQRARGWAASCVLATVFLYALLCLRCNEARPLLHPRFVTLPRESQYLDIHASHWTPALQRISADIARSGCDSVGLKLGFDAFEYPIWLMLRDRGFTGTINHCFVEHVSGRLPVLNPTPAAIIAKVSTPPPAITNLYPHTSVYGPLMILWRSDTRPNHLTQR